MELELGSPSVEGCGSTGQRGASDGGGQAAGSACARQCRCVVLGRQIGRTSLERWAITWSKTPTLTGGSAHELSKLPVTLARWSAERIGPTIIATPHRGHTHVAPGFVSVVTVAVAC